MSTQRAQLNINSMAKLIKLYDLRQAKARKAYQVHQTQVHEAQVKFDKRENEYKVVFEEKAKLQLLEQAPEYASDLCIQQHIALKRRWLQYDFERAQYFLNDARADLLTEKQEAEKLRSAWMQLRAKCERFEAKLVLAKNNAEAAMNLKEEAELEDELVGRLVISQRSSMSHSSSSSVSQSAQRHAVGDANHG